MDGAKYLMTNMFVLWNTADIMMMLLTSPGQLQKCQVFSQNLVEKEMVQD
jgi:hypothetical protein